MANPLGIGPIFLMSFMSRIQLESFVIIASQLGDSEVPGGGALTWRAERAW